MTISESRIEGRFNYLSFSLDFYNVIFVPYRSPIVVIVARNLTKEDAVALISELNEGLKKAREKIMEDEDNYEPD